MVQVDGKANVPDAELVDQAALEMMERLGDPEVVPVALLVTRRRDGGGLGPLDALIPKYVPHQAAVNLFGEVFRSMKAQWSRRKRRQLNQ